MTRISLSHKSHNAMLEDIDENDEYLEQEEEQEEEEEEEEVTTTNTTKPKLLNCKSVRFSFKVDKNGPPLSFDDNDFSDEDENDILSNRNTISKKEEEEEIDEIKECTLEGALLSRRATSYSRYKKCYVVMNLLTEEITCFKNPPPTPPAPIEGEASVSSEESGEAVEKKEKKGMVHKLKKSIFGGGKNSKVHHHYGSPKLNHMEFGKSHISSKRKNVKKINLSEDLSSATSDATDVTIEEEEDDLSTLSSYSTLSTTTSQVASTVDLDAKDHTRLSIIKQNQLSTPSTSTLIPHEAPLWTIPPSIPWTLRDVINDDYMFQIVIPSSYDLSTSSYKKGITEGEDQVIQFKTQILGNEKHLWLKSASTLNRLATHVSTCTCPIERTKRKQLGKRERTGTSLAISEMARELEEDGDLKRSILCSKALRDSLLLEEEKEKKKGVAFDIDVDSSSCQTKEEDNDKQQQKQEERQKLKKRNKSMLLKPIKFNTNKKSTKNNHSQSKSTKNLLSENDKTKEDESLKLIQQLTHLNLIDDIHEHKLLPTSVYPHRWMTEKEMFYEQIKPSLHYHDLSHQNCGGSGRVNLGKVIGHVQIEVLSCIGLRKKSKKNIMESETISSMMTMPDRRHASIFNPQQDPNNKNKKQKQSKKKKKKQKYNTVVYILSSTYGFTTDVIPKKSRPLWLPKSKRGCIIPIHHLYGKVYIGVFDDHGGGGGGGGSEGGGGENKEDDFLGRVVLDVARLRPNSLYDVKLPLRLYNTVYSQCSHGLIRLRFKLTWAVESSEGGERMALFSYWKKPIPPSLAPTPTPMNNSQDGESSKTLSKKQRKASSSSSSPARSKKSATTPVTIKCADIKAFRNVVLTLHGMNLPGNYSRKYMTCALREHKLYQKAIVNSLKALPKHIKTWENPLLSSFVFISWMHIVNSGSLSLIPQYIMFFIIYTLLRNYIYYGSTKSPIHNKFNPVSLEELIRVLLFGGRSKNDNNSNNNNNIIQPLELRGITASDYAKTDGQFGLYLDHMEFPFSEGDRYRKKTLADACLFSSNHSLKGKCQFAMNALLEEIVEEEEDDEDDDEDDDDESLDDSLYEENDEEEELDDETSERSTFSNASTSTLPPVLEDESTIEEPTHSSFNDDDDDDTDKSTTSSSTMTKTRRPLKKKKKKNEDKANDIPDDELDTSSSASSHQHAPLWKSENVPLPEQDIHKKTVSSKTKISDEMIDFREKLHDATFRLFDEHVYYIPPPPGSKSCASLAYVSHSSSMSDDDDTMSTDKEEEGSTTGTTTAAEEKSPSARELDKILGINTSYNPLVTKLAEFFTPLTQIIMIQNCAFRSGFNLFMWRDPYLSFWALVVCIVILLVLMVFPWRLFLLALGVFSVGPQNWLLRKIKENKASLANRTDGLKESLITRIMHKDTAKQSLEKVSTTFSSNDESLSNVSSLQGPSTVQKRGYSILKRQGSNAKKKKGTKVSSSSAQNMSSSKAAQDPPTPEFALQNHLRTSSGGDGGSGGGKNTTKQDVSTSSITYDAVVPYSPLLQSRFYDWPPERMHTSVKVCEN